MFKRLSVAIVASAAPGLSWGQIVSYEATSVFPDQDGWTRIIQPYQSDRWLSDGSLVQYSQQVPAGQVTEEQQDPYRRGLDDQAGFPTWFLQFRVITDTPPVYQDVGPASVAAGSNSGVLYHFVIGDSQIRFLRDVSLPYVYANIQPGVPHTYRLELRGAQSYSLWIDSVLIDSGVPEGPYPVANCRMNFRGEASAPINTTMWDYVRFGKIPADHSGDFDSNGIVDLNDVFFFVDCLLAQDYDSSGPGCRFADMNADGRADGADVQLFVNAMTGG
jgi:hypothetical protein